MRGGKVVRTDRITGLGAEELADFELGGIYQGRRIFVDLQEIYFIYKFGKK